MIPLSWNRIMTSDTDTYQHPEGITSAFSTFKESCPSHQQWWTEYGVNLELNFSIDPYLLTEASSGRIEQNSQYETHSPSVAQHQPVRDTSIPAHEISDEILLQPLEPNKLQHQIHPSPRQQNTKKQDMLHVCASAQATGNNVEANNDNALPVSSARPLKRKRGRPRLDSYLNETQDANCSQTRSSSARELHLEKNRIAAAKCRERSKEVTTTLVTQAKELASTNKALRADEILLREQVLVLKSDLLLHAGCGSWAIDRYVERRAGDILGVEAPPLRKSERRDSHISQCPEDSIGMTDDVSQEDITDLLENHSSMSSSIESDEYNVLNLLNMGENVDGLYEW